MAQANKSKPHDSAGLYELRSAGSIRELATG